MGVARNNFRGSWRSIISAFFHLGEVSMEHLILRPGEAYKKHHYLQLTVFDLKQKLTTLICDLRS